MSAKTINTILSLKRSMPPNSRIHALLGARILNFTKLSSNKQEKRGCRISKYFCWAAALLLPKMASKSVMVPMPFYKRSSFIDIPFGMPYFKLFYF